MVRTLIFMLAVAQLLSAQMTILSAEGQVFVRTGSSGAFRSVNPGEILSPNATVLTRENSRAVLVSRDGTTHVLRPDSRLVVPVVNAQTSSSLYDAAVAKNQSRQRTRLSMTQVGATRSEDSAEPLKNQALSEVSRSTLIQALAALIELGLSGGIMALAQGALFEEFK